VVRPPRQEPREGSTERHQPAPARPTAAGTPRGGTRPRNGQGPTTVVYRLHEFLQISHVPVPAPHL